MASIATDFKVESAYKKTNEKATQIQWEQIETRMKEEETDVLATLMKYVEKNRTELDDHQVYGDLYNDVRDLITFLKPNNEKKSEKNNKPEKKVDIIRRKNTTKKQRELVTDLMEHIQNENSGCELMMRSTRSLSSNVIEIIGITFMIMMNYIEKNTKKTNGERIEENLKIHIGVGTLHFLNMIKKYKGTSFLNPEKETKVSNTFISDFEDVRNHYIKKNPCDSTIIIENTPECVYQTKFDKFIPSEGLKPRRHQSDIIDFVDNNFDDGFLVYYTPSIGSGKTSVAVPLSHMIHLRRNEPKYKKIQLIFACNINSVRFEVARMCYNMGIKFAIGGIVMDSRTKTEKVRVVNHNSCSNSSDRVIIICNPTVASIIMADETNNENEFILFLDEPTQGADSSSSASLRYNSEIMLNLPKRTVLSSATIDSTNLNVNKEFNEKYPTSRIATISSNEAFIGCNVHSFTGTIVFPHNGAKTQDELKKIISNVENNFLLNRMYTLETFKYLCSEAKALGIKDISDPNEVFADIMNLSGDNIRKLTIELLKKISDQSNDDIEKFCSIKEAISISDTVNFRNMQVNDLWKNNNGQTLIICNNPKTDAISFFNDHIEYVKSKIGTVNEMMESYKVEMSRYEKRMEELKKAMNDEGKRSTDDAKKSAKDNDTTKIIKGKMSRSDRSNDSSQAELHKPDLKFPKEAKLGTVEFNRVFVSDRKVRNHRTPFIVDTSAIEQMREDDSIIILLLSGVGIYSILNEGTVYHDIMMNLASKGALPYIIADPSIGYGTNMPINREIIKEDLEVNSYSVNSIFQMIGRAGRVNKSWRAEAYLPDQLIEKIMKYVKNPTELQIETDNINKMMETIKMEKMEK